MPSRVIVLFLCLISSQLLAHSSKRSQRANVDPDYTTALAAANRFLNAWQTQDHETGIIMLTDSARQHVSPDQLQEFFSPEANAAFEIEHGKKLNAHAYVFPAVLFGLSGTHQRAHGCTIVIAHTGKNEWSVDKLP